MANELFPKRCKVYPRNGMQFIPGILEKQKRIEFPAELPLSLKELRRCLSYATCYEVTDGGDVLLTLENFTLDNSKATPAEDVPEDELQHPRDEEEDADDEEEKEEETVRTQAAKAASAPTPTPKVQQNQKNQKQQYTAKENKAQKEETKSEK